VSTLTNDGVHSEEKSASPLESVMLELYTRSGAQAFGLECGQFRAILTEIARKYLPGETSPQAAAEFCGSLRLEELALARACAAGSERAWEIFLTRYRAKLYDVASYIAKESSAARELADSLYADLYGTSERDGKRVSKLAFYTGRGSLEGWLRTVLAQEYVNRYRKRRRLVSLDEEAEEGVQFAAVQTEPAASADPRLEQAIDHALKALPAEDKYVLASYFLDNRTLAEVARTLGVHESTISRKVDKLAKNLRKQILNNLTRSGLSRRQAEEALLTDVRDLKVNIRSRLVQESAAPAFPEKKAKASEG
jgi:RNA polymerase sigma-70 factor (ECF subfamily)